VKSKIANRAANELLAEREQVDSLDSNEPKDKPVSRNFLPRFRSEIERLGERAEAVIAQERRFELRYVPFEHVNRNARLVFVGITPGMNQIALSYMALRSKLLSGVGTDRALAAAKTAKDGHYVVSPTRYEKDYSC
jgi:hypothetical protein